MEQDKVKRKTVEQALAALRRQCARMERSEFDVRRSMMRWQMTADEVHPHYPPVLGESVIQWGQQV